MPHTPRCVRIRAEMRTVIVPQPGTQFIGRTDWTVGLTSNGFFEQQVLEHQCLVAGFANVDEAAVTYKFIAFGYNGQSLAQLTDDISNNRNSLYTLVPLEPGTTRLLFTGPARPTCFCMSEGSDGTYSIAWVEDLAAAFPTGEMCPTPEPMP